MESTPMIDCRTVAQLLSSDDFSKQGYLRRAEIRLHLWMCRHCSRFAKQIEQIRGAARSLKPSLDAKAQGPEEDTLENRILRRLSKHEP